MSFEQPKFEPGEKESLPSPEYINNAQQALEDYFALRPEERFYY